MSDNIAVVYSINRRIFHVNYLILIANFLYTCANNFALCHVLQKIKKRIKLHAIRSGRNLMEPTDIARNHTRVRAKCALGIFNKTKHITGIAGSYKMSKFLKVVSGKQFVGNLI